MTDPLLFLLAVLTILAAPGPTNVLLATSGATTGVGRSLPLLGAALLGYLVTILLVRVVLSPVIAAWPVVGTLLKVTVAIYVAWLAVRLWLRPSTLTAAVAVDFRMVLIVTLLNPKAFIFALTVIPLTHAALWAYFAAFAVCVLVCGGGWVLLGGAVGAASRGRHTGLIQKIAAVALGGFAGVILASAFA
jgi:threonine/homoserine/homoserine lactone efflux protein